MDSAIGCRGRGRGERDVRGGVGGQREEGLRNVRGEVRGRSGKLEGVQGGGERCEVEGRDVRGRGGM